MVTCLMLSIVTVTGFKEMLSQSRSKVPDLRDPVHRFFNALMANFIKY